MKRIVRSVVVLLVLLAAAIAGGSLYMLSYSLTPDATMQAKNASSYEYMYGEYPFLRPWGDSLERAGALRDTVIAGSGGERLHALYAAAAPPDGPYGGDRSRLYGQCRADADDRLPL